MSSKWRVLADKVIHSECLVIHRPLFRTEGARVQLIGFCDASQYAYAAVTYLRVTEAGESLLHLLTSKTRVAPLKEMTIPKLELLSALLLSRLVSSVEKVLKEEMELVPTVCFTDSRVALGWVKQSKREWKQFVENRVSEIRSLMPLKSWYHCAGVDNPVDIPSRGVGCLDKKFGQCG